MKMANQGSARLCYEKHYWTWVWWFIPTKELKKIKDIQNNSEFSALFYDSKKLLQIRIEGKAELITDKEQIATYWHTVQQASKKDYTTSIAPGIPIKNPEEVS
jgi:general stress protein 26